MGPMPKCGPALLQDAYSQVYVCLYKVLHGVHCYFFHCCRNVILISLQYRGFSGLLFNV